MSTSLTSKDVLYKQPREKFAVGCNFGNVLGAGDSITGTPYIVVTPSGDISMENIFVGSDIAYVTIGSGVANQDYRFEFEVVTTSGYIYVGDCLLKVRDR